MPLSIKQKLFLALLFITPIFTLTIKHWTGALLVICSILAIFLLSTKADRFSKPSLTPIQKKMMWAIVVTLMAPSLAILISQFFRGALSWQAYDAPSKFLLAIPIFLLLSTLKVDLEKPLEYIFPATVLVTFLLMPFLPKTYWANDPSRVTTFFVDPLTFGRLCITFAILSLATLDFKNPFQLGNLFKILGFVVGVYLSIKSGSRTGWAALPVALLLIFSIQFKRKFLAFIIGVILSISLSLILYQNIITIKERTNMAIQEITTYQMNGMNPINSVGQRISFMRMGSYYFGLKPLAGWGDDGFKSHINDPELTKYAHEYTRQFPLNSGFHNEFMTNAVRSGIWGIISTTLLFLAPAWIFFFSKKHTSSKNLIYLGTLYLICEFISGMSTEVFNLKFTASLYAIILSIILGSLVSTINNEPQ